MNPRDADHRNLKLAPGGATLTIASGLSCSHASVVLQMCTLSG